MYDAISILVSPKYRCLEREAERGAPALFPMQSFPKSVYCRAGPWYYPRKNKTQNMGGKQCSENYPQTAESRGKNSTSMAKSLVLL